MTNSNLNTRAPRTCAKIQNEQAPPIAGSNGKSQAPNGSRPLSKLDLIRSLMVQPNGAMLDELVSATSWQPHSVRDGMTGLRKQGLTLLRTKVDGTTRFSIEAQPAEAAV